MRSCAVLRQSWLLVQIQKALFYVLAAHSDLEHDEPDGSTPFPTSSTLTPTPEPAPKLPTPNRPALSPALHARCKSLLTALIAHCTPLLFTVPTAAHMPCTDALADAWMALVVHPALASGALCRPLEMLEDVRAVDWGARGVCEGCVREKREEWRVAREDVWGRMDGWLGLPGARRELEEGSQT